QGITAEEDSLVYPSLLPLGQAGRGRARGLWRLNHGKGHNSCTNPRVSRGARTQFPAQALGKTQLQPCFGSVSHESVRHEGRTTSAPPPPRLGQTSPWLRH